MYTCKKWHLTCILRKLCNTLNNVTENCIRRDNMQTESGFENKATFTVHMSCLALVNNYIVEKLKKKVSSWQLC